MRALDRESSLGSSRWRRLTSFIVQNYPAYNQSTIDGLKLVASGHMDAFRVSLRERAELGVDADSSLQRPTVLVLLDLENRLL